MAFTHGSKAKFRLDNSSNVLTDISAFVTNVSFPQTADVADASVLGNTFKTYVLGLTDATISLDGRFDPTMDVVLAGAIQQVLASYTYQYDPQGSTTGLIRYSGESVCTNYQVTAGIGDVAAWSATLQCVGAITRSTVP